MGQAIAFDTHAYVKKLRAVGFTEEQAEVQTAVIADLLDERLATKHDIMLLKRDIKEMEAALKRDIKELEMRVNSDIKELEMRLTIKLGAIATTGIIIVAALVKLL